MSLHIYIGEKNLPRTAKVIKDVEEFFPRVMVKVDEFSKQVISEIDKGELIDNNSFIDRFGHTLYLSQCSTGSKILLAAQYSDFTILADEMGMNCDELLLSIKDGSVYYTEKHIHFSSFEQEMDIILNGKQCNDSEELIDVMEGIIEGGGGK